MKCESVMFRDVHVGVMCDDGICEGGDKIILSSQILMACDSLLGLCEVWEAFLKPTSLPGYCFILIS